MNSSFTGVMRDESFIAEVPELAGCMADGKTYKEALSNAEIIIQEWIENCQRIKNVLFPNQRAD